MNILYLFSLFTIFILYNIILVVVKPETVIPAILTERLTLRAAMQIGINLTAEALSVTQERHFMASVQELCIVKAVIRCSFWLEGNRNP